MVWIDKALADGPLRGARILIAEDEALIAFELEATFKDAGAQVIGPAFNVRAALDLAERGGLSAAVLDLRLDRETSQPIARHLSTIGVPFLIYTGQSDVAAIRAEWPACIDHLQADPVTHPRRRCRRPAALEPFPFGWTHRCRRPSPQPSPGGRGLDPRRGRVRARRRRLIPLAACRTCVSGVDGPT